MNFQGRCSYTNDSKGLVLNEFIPNNLKEQFKVVAVSGGTVDNSSLIDKLLRKVRRHRDPIVFVWLGTCELTKKIGKYTSIRHYPFKYQNIEYTIDQYIELRDKIKNLNLGASVTFLECPYYSIHSFNKRNKALNETTISKTKSIQEKGSSLKVVCKKNYPTLVINKYKNKRVAAFKSMVDNDLSNLVDYYNEHIRILNKFKPPRISQDIIDSRKGRKKRKTTYRKNFTLYKDGIHPEETLANLWLYKFIELAVEIDQQLQGCGY